MFKVHARCYVVIFVWLITLSITYGARNSRVKNENNETRLVENLINISKKSPGSIFVRPVVNPSDTLDIQFGMILLHINGLDYENGVLSSSMWFTYSWTDFRLSWDPADYDGLLSVRIPVAKIWTPDITLYNQVIEDEVFKNPGIAMAVVSSKGYINWVTRHNLKTPCNVGEHKDDIHECTFKFGSWTYHGALLDVNLYNDLASIDIRDYKVSHNWQITSNTAVKNEKVYDCCPEKYQDMLFTLKIQQKMQQQNKKNATEIDDMEPYKYLTFIFMPIILLTVIMLMIFCVPSGMDSKLNLGMFVFFGYMGMIVLMNVLPEISEHSAQFTHLHTHLQWFLIAMLCLVTFVIMMSICTINIARKGEAGLLLPECIRKGFNNCLGCLLCVFYNRQRYLKKFSIESWDKNELIVANRDWRTCSEVLDRILFFLCLIVVSVAAVFISIYV